MDIANKIAEIKKEIGSATLVAVSKTQPVELLMQAYKAGQRDFGENKIQEMVLKQQQMPDDVRWHMIGHVQTNKVRQMASFVHLIHGVDSEKLLAGINSQSQKHDRIIDCLLQFIIASEDSKFGLNEDELSEIISNLDAGRYPSVRVRGLMGMATFTDDRDQIQREFTHLRTLYDRYASVRDFDTLSMGMSGDFDIAVKCGSTMVRVGSRIFGARNY